MPYHIKPWEKWVIWRKERSLPCTVTIDKKCVPELDRLCLECYEYYVKSSMGMTKSGM